MISEITKLAAKKRGATKPVTGGALVPGTALPQSKLDAMRMAYPEDTKLVDLGVAEAGKVAPAAPAVSAAPVADATKAAPVAGVTKAETKAEAVVPGKVSAWLTKNRRLATAGAVAAALGLGGAYALRKKNQG